MDSPAVASAEVAQKLILKVTAGNLRQNHHYIGGHLDFFPSDAVGPARRGGVNGHGIEIVLSGLDRTIYTDIPRDAKTGKPRQFFRDRQAIGKFYRHHRLAEGSHVIIERLAERNYVLSVSNSPVERQKPRAAEFFAGIGLVRLALERQGWDVVFANDIDDDKAKMYRHNWPQDDHLIVGDIHNLKPSDIPDCEIFTASPLQRPLHRRPLGRPQRQRIFRLLGPH
jgi:hypothetical protein